MIVIFTAGLLFFLLISFCLWADTKFKESSYGIGFCSLLVGLFIVHLIFWNSKYPEPKETIYPINIAPNHVAYITDKENIINISCIFNQNITEEDKYIKTEYPGYWAGPIYVDGKTEHKILKQSDSLVP